MRKTIIKVLSLLLAAVLLGGCGTRSGGSVSPFASLGDLLSLFTASLEEPAAPEEKEPGDGVHAEVDFADMEWYRYNMREFNSRARRLVKTKDEGEAEELYNWLLTEYKRLQTLNEIAWIKFYENGIPPPVRPRTSSSAKPRMLSAPRWPTGWTGDRGTPSPRSWGRRPASFSPAMRR